MLTSHQLAERLSEQIPGSLGRAASRGVLWTTLQSLANRASGMLVFLVLARLLVPADFGLLAAALVFVSLATTLAEAGLTRTLVQRPVLRAAHLDAALMLNLTAGALLSGALIAAAPLVASLYELPALVDVLRALAVVPLLSSLSAVPDSILRRQLRFRSLALRSTSGVVLGGVVGVAAAFLGAGAWALVLQVLSQSLMAFVVLWSSIRWRPSLRVEREAVTELVGFGSHVLGISLLKFFNQRTGEFLIGVFIGPVPLGLYVVAQRIQNMIMDLLVANVQKVALPVFSRLSEEPQRLAAAYLRSTQITTIAASPVFALLALLGPEIVPAVFGSQWNAAGPLVAIVALAGPVQSITYFNNSVLLARGRSLLALKWTSAYSVVSLGTVVAMVGFGLTAVAVGLTVRAWVMMPVGLLMVRRVTTVTMRNQLHTFLVPVAGVLAMAAVVLAAHAVDHDAGSPAWLVPTGAAALAGYGVVVGLLRRDLLGAALVTVRRRLGREVGVESEPTTSAP